MKTALLSGAVVELPENLRLTDGLQLCLSFVQPEETNALRVHKMLAQALGGENRTAFRRSARPVIEAGGVAIPDREIGCILVEDGFFQWGDDVPPAFVALGWRQSMVHIDQLICKPQPFSDAILSESKAAREAISTDEKRPVVSVITNGARN